MSTEPVTPAPEPAQPEAAVPPPPPPLPPVAPDKSVLETRPEILVGAAAAGGFLVAQILGRIRGR